MFIEFHPRWLGAVKAYCFNYPLETLAVAHLIGLHQNKSVHPNRDGKLYIYFEDDEVKALVFFNNKNVMHISNHSDGLYEKVDFLKSIHKMSPKMIKGTHVEVDHVFYFLQRALKSFSFYSSRLMVYSGDVIECLPKDIISAKSIDWHRQGQFLLEVEKAFRVDALSINYLRQKTVNQSAIDFYDVYKQNGTVIGQVIGELSTFKYGIIGGIYVRPSARGMGVGRSLLEAAVYRYQTQNRVPVLYVENSNPSAISLYENYGFRKALDTMEMMVSL